MKRLLERLELEARLVEALLTATEEERLALGGGDIERIMACTDRKRSILQAYDSLGVSRDHLLEKLRGGSSVIEGTSTLREFILSSGDPAADEMVAALDKIQEMGRRLHRLNATNTVLMQRSMDWAARARAAMTGSTTSQTTYTRRGGYRNASANAGMFREASEMGSLLGLLQTGFRGVQTQQALTEIAGQNITNASVDGYRRRSGIIATYPGANHSGVHLRAQEQARDVFLAREMISNRTELMGERALRSSLEGLEPYLNDLEGNGLSGAMDELFSSFGDLSEDPSDLAARQNVLSSAERFTTRIRSVAAELESARQATNERMGTVVSDVNDRLQRVATLNKQIAARPGASAALRDERDQIVQELAGSLGLTATETDGGMVNLVAAGGQSLVQGDVALSLSMEIPAGGGEPRPVITSPGGDVSELARPVGGELGGLLTARDDVLLVAAGQLDRFAYEFSAAVNGIHTAGFGLDTANGRAFFEPPTGVDGAAADLRLSADIAGQPENIAACADLNAFPGDNAIVQALMDLRTQGAFGDSGVATAGEALGQVSDTVARRLGDARAGEAAQETVLAQVEALHASRTGVSIEEELVAVTAAQRAYEASTKVIQTADQLIQAVLQLR